MNAELIKKIDDFAADSADAMLRDISRLVAINSVEGEAEENAPFGPGPKKALDEILAIAGENGLETVNCENRIGYACIGGKGENYLATITHVDVVPAGDGWKGSPFEMREREGYIIGRGVLDDKGPSIVCLYALKFLKEAGIELKYPVRALFGANEESGMGDVEYYLANYAAPIFCFSPDADFPLICGEKGIWHGEIISTCAPENIKEIHGGLAVNAVPANCEAVVKFDGELKDTADVTAVRCEEGWKLSSKGIAGHASTPAGTVNAIGLMIDYILDNGIASAEEKKFLEFAASVHHAYDGSCAGIAATDPSGLFEPLTVVSGMIGIRDGRFWQSLDSRYVPSTSGEEIIAKLSEKAGDAAVIVQKSNAVPFCKSPDSPEVCACMDAYRSVTGDLKAEPFTIGGGTYARDFPNAVAFGPCHLDRENPEWAGSIHGAEEATRVSELVESLKVYITSLINLEQLTF